MDLNNADSFTEVDQQGFYRHIDAWPDQLAMAWEIGQILPCPIVPMSIERIIILGIGDGALAGELISSLVADSCPVPILINRQFELPAHINGQGVLVVAISHRGNTAEVLSATEMAIARGTQLLAITMGGQLAQRVEQAGGTVWQYTYAAPARAALGWTLGLLLALIARLGMAPDLQTDIVEAVALLQQNVATWGLASPAIRNPTKRMAGQLIDRLPLIYGAGLTAPIARRWKQMFNTAAKSLAQWEELPELNHNALSGMLTPPSLVGRLGIIFLVSNNESPALTQRWEILRELYLQQSLIADTIRAQGTSTLAQVCSLLHYGDYVSYYLAILYQVDPTITPVWDEMKDRLSQSSAT